MKLTSTQTTYFVEHAGCHYRTTDGNNWEVAMGESWEPEYHAEHALSKMFESLRPKPLDRWNDFMWALGALYQSWSKGGWSTEEVSDLMKAYDEWLG